jgi:hypothetical protein
MTKRIHRRYNITARIEHDVTSYPRRARAQRWNGSRAVEVFTPAPQRGDGLFGMTFALSFESTDAARANR